MENEPIYLCDVRELKEKKTFGQKVKEKLIKAKRWIEENPETLAAIPIVFGLGKRVVKTVRREHKNYRENYNRTRTMYDHSLNQRLELKHEMSNSEKREFARRRDNGEKVHEALKHMNMLK